MKKSILTLLILIAPIILTGCNEKNQFSPNKEKETKTEMKKETTKTNSVIKNDEEYKIENNINNKKQMKYKKQSEQENLLAIYNQAILKTTMGDIKIKFYENSPITVNNFLNLSKDGYYDGIKFHRIINNFMVQGGDIFSKDDSMKNRWGQGGPGYAIEDEFIEGLSNTVGTIAMANSGPNTGGSQFFINLIDNSRLDWDKGDPRSKHPVFGEIIEGMDIVEKIGKVKTVRDLPVEPVIINSVELIKK